VSETAKLPIRNEWRSGAALDLITPFVVADVKRAG
jgi:hypothetical protein